VTYGGRAPAGLAALLDVIAERQVHKSVASCTRVLHSDQAFRMRQPALFCSSAGGPWAAAAGLEPALQEGAPVPGLLTAEPAFARSVCIKHRENNLFHDYQHRSGSIKHQHRSVCSKHRENIFFLDYQRRSGSPSPQAGVSGCGLTSCRGCGISDQRVLHSFLQGSGQEAAETYLAKLGKDGRYQRDVWLV